MRALLLCLMLMAGCTTPLTNFYDLPKKQGLSQHNATIDSFKQYYFTDEASNAIRDIPLEIGFAGQSAQAWGINIWTDILSVVTGVGPGRKVTIKEGKIQERGLVGVLHEYIHQLDDLDRDGEGEFIDHDEWKAAYIRMAKDPRYAGLVHFTEDNANNWITEVFGVGEYSEHIAYAGSLAYWYGGPSYFLDTYRKMLRVDRKQHYETIGPK